MQPADPTLVFEAALHINTGPKGSGDGIAIFCLRQPAKARDGGGMLRRQRCRSKGNAHQACASEPDRDGVAPHSHILHLARSNSYWSADATADDASLLACNPFFNGGAGGAALRNLGSGEITPVVTAFKKRARWISALSLVSGSLMAAGVSGSTTKAGRARKR